MSTCLTAIAIEASEAAILIQVAVRPARGCFAYAAPSLARMDGAAAKRGLSRPLGIRDIILRTWSRRYDGEAERLLHEQIDAGELVLPRDCPFDPGATLAGKNFGPFPAFESLSCETQCNGAGQWLETKIFQIIDSRAALSLRKMMAEPSQKALHRVAARRIVSGSGAAKSPRIFFGVAV